MNEINVKWHPYPKEKPPKEGDYLVTLVVGVKPFTHYLHYAPFTLGRGSKTPSKQNNDPLQRGRRIYTKSFAGGNMSFRYEPDKCPFGACDEHQPVGIEGPIYDCDICNDVQAFMKLTENNRKYISEGIQTAITVDFEDNKYSYMSSVLSAMSRLLQELGEIKDIGEELDSYGILAGEIKNINVCCKDIFRNANVFLLKLLNIWGCAAEKEKKE